MHHLNIGKAFVRLNDLRRHARQHTDEKAYPCSVCGKRFSRNDTLKAHRSTCLSNQLALDPTTDDRLTHPSNNAASPSSVSEVTAIGSNECNYASNADRNAEPDSSGPTPPSSHDQYTSPQAFPEPDYGKAARETRVHDWLSYAGPLEPVTIDIIAWEAEADEPSASQARSNLPPTIEDVYTWPFDAFRGDSGFESSNEASHYFLRCCDDLDGASDDATGSALSDLAEDDRNLNDILGPGQAFQNSTRLYVFSLCVIS